MIFNKNEIQLFLETNSGKKSTIQRFVSSIEALDLPNLFETLSAAENNVFYFSNPSENFAFLSFDQLITSSKENDFSCVNFNSPVLSEKILYSSHPPKDFKIPLYIGSQKFTRDKSETIWQDFSYQEWFIPKILLINNNDSYHLIINFILGDSDLSFLDMLENILCEESNARSRIIPTNKFESKDDSKEWSAKVKIYLNEIHNNRIEKAVLARRVIIDLQNISYSYALRELKNKYPNCITFAFKKNNSVFFGATPEKLFSLNNGHLQTEAIAGSSPRGTDTIEDRLIEQKLLSDPKELIEHKNVVDFIKSNLADIVINQVSDMAPGIKKLKNIQHIKTSISAEVKEGINILDIVKSLHPTPAVCGFPQKEAFELIESTEKFDRGLYSGIIGWFDEKQTGEFIVGIRSALVKKNRLYAYAGCGIVKGSDPISEYKETELKLKPILSLFNNEIIS